MAALLEAEKLQKSFGDIHAVADLSLSLSKGEVVGLLGPNGAGKTTSIRMMTGFLTPDSGTARVCGAIVSTGDAQARRALGYLPEGAPLYGDMKTGAFLRFVADVHGLTGLQRDDAVARSAAALRLEKVLDQRIDTLSKGFRRRVAFAGSTIHDPQVLVMDEPTDGLDPNQKHEVRNLIRDMAADRAILISTHILEEVDSLCSRAALITGGRLVVDEAPSVLKSRSAWRGAVTMVAPGGDAGDICKALEAIDGVARTERVDEGDMARISALPASGSDIADAVGAVVAAGGWHVSQYSLESGRLDDVFRSLTGGASS